MKALITAGGRATRMRPITHTINKHLIPLANRPMIVNAIEKIVEAGVTDIVINVNPGETELQKALGDGSAWNAKLTFVEQIGGPKGLAHIVKNAREALGNEPFIFYLGDNIILGSIKKFVDTFTEKNLDVLLALAQVRDPQRFGVPEIKDGRIVRVLEKPANPPSNFAVTGIYICNSCIFDACERIAPSARGEYEFPDAVSALIDDGKVVGYEEITGWWKDTGLPRDLLEGNALMLDQMRSANGADFANSEQDISIQGFVSIGKNCKIGSHVLIRGPVAIGDDCVLEDCYIGPYTSIGNGVQIKQAEIEHSIVFEQATINHAGRIVDSIIGQKATISSAISTKPRGNKLIVGDNSSVEL